MKVLRAAVAVSLSLLLSGCAQEYLSGKPNSSKVAQLLIDASIDSYSGSCPCPYNTDRAGHSCGGRSAYSKPGGEDPICYMSDVTPDMIDDYVKKHPNAGR